MAERSPIGTYVAQCDNSVKKLLVKQFANFMSQKALWANALTCIHCSFGNCFYSKSQSLYSELLGSSGSGLRASPLPPHHPTSSPRHSAPATLSSLCPPIKPGIHPPQGLSTCQSHIYPQLFPPLSLSHVALKCLICLLNKAFLDYPILKDSSFSPLTHILLPCLIFLCQLIALWHAVMFYFCSCLPFFSRLSSVKALILSL